MIDLGTTYIDAHGKKGVKTMIEACKGRNDASTKDIKEIKSSDHQTKYHEHEMRVDKLGKNSRVVHNGDFSRLKCKYGTDQ